MPRLVNKPEAPFEPLPTVPKQDGPRWGNFGPVRVLTRGQVEPANHGQRFA